MFVGNIKDMPRIDMSPSGAKDAVKQVAIGAKEGWEDYVMRVMTIGQNGNTPKHIHDWPHINYVISGSGQLWIEGNQYAIGAGSCAYVPSNAEHCFVNMGEGPLEFICIVPTKGEA